MSRRRPVLSGLSHRQSLQRGLRADVGIRQ